MSNSRYGHMVHEYYVRRLKEIRSERRERLAGITSRAGAEAYVRYVRNAVRRSFGHLPERTPLNARVVEVESYDSFAVEKVLFESRPGFLVTGTVYRPKQSGDMFPGVLGLCGHSQSGKAEDKYQAFCIGLAQKGFIVCIIDPISQGERIQFLKSDGAPLPSLCGGHNLMGNQQVLLGDFFGTWRVWDAMRGLDYLLSRRDVDPSRIGVTGNSGGGTLTTFLTALDPRITMAAPSCYICSYLANLENELPADAEQNPPGILAFGLDEADLLMCYAPRPTMILSQIEDFFDERAARTAFEELRRIHELLGSPGTAEYFVGTHEHGFHRENREAMYGFFLKHAGVSGDPVEDEFEPIPESKLFATENGDAFAAGSRRVFDFIRESGIRLSTDRARLDETELIDAANRLLSIPETSGPPPYRVLFHYHRRRADLNQRSQFAIETETGIQVILTVFGTTGGKAHPPEGPIAVYVGHTDGETDIETIPVFREMTTGDRPIVVVDPRGMGVSLADTCNSEDFFDAYGSDYLYASVGELLDESYFGRRVFDLLRAIDFLLSHNAGDIELIGRGLGSVITAFAALLHPSRPTVRLFHYLPSFTMLTEDPPACWPLSSLPRGILRYCDLPDIYTALGSRLTMDEPWDARMQPYR